MAKVAKTFVAEKNVRNTVAKEKKKTVYKHLLDSAFQLKWPRVNATLNDTIFAELLKALEPISQYKKQVRTNKKQKKQETLEKPDLFNRLHIGINSVAQFLETYIQNKRLNTPLPTTTPVIYICKREMKPQNLCQHILYMAAIANIQLLVLPNESECKLGQALNISRASLILVEIKEGKEEKLRLLSKDIPLIDAPWLQNALTQKAHFLTDNIKTLKTQAPIIVKNQQQQQRSNKRKADQDQQLPQEENSKKPKI